MSTESRELPERLTLQDAISKLADIRDRHERQAAAASLVLQLQLETEAALAHSRAQDSGGEAVCLSKEGAESCPWYAKWIQLERYIAKLFDDGRVTPTTQPAGAAVEAVATLANIRDLLSSLPLDCLGDGMTADGQSYPIRDEVIDSITRVLAVTPQQRSEQVAGGGGVELPLPQEWYERAIALIVQRGLDAYPQKGAIGLAREIVALFYPTLSTRDDGAREKQS